MVNNFNETITRKIDNQNLTFGDSLNCCYFNNGRFRRIKQLTKSGEKHQNIQWSRNLNKIDK